MSAIKQDLDEYLAGPDPDYDTDPEPPQDADEDLADAIHRAQTGGL